MQIAPWVWYTSTAVIAFGITGLLQKLTTNRLSADSALVVLVAGLLLLEPLFYPGPTILHYSHGNLSWAVLSGFFNALGGWALFAAMKSGGSASVVSTLTALYPVIVVLFAPFILHETITMLQIAGITCALLASAFLALDSEGDRPR